MDRENFEPKWTKKISNDTICRWFYIFFIANIIVVALVLAAGVYALVIKGSSRVTSGSVFFALLQLIVAGTNTLFFYLICDRSLQPAQ